MSMMIKQFGKTLAVTGQWDYVNKLALREFMEGEAMKDLLQKIAHDVIVVLGGDGTMQQAIDMYRSHGLPFLGINFGSRGYLLHPLATLEKAKGFSGKEYPLLTATVDRDGQVSEHFAFGDVYLKPGNPLGVCQYDLHVKLPEGSCGTQGIMGDGVIISTPAGSTGYTRNAGGPVLPHGSDNLIITHINPDRSRGLTPIVVSGDSTVIIEAKNNSRRPILVATDGRCIADCSGSKAVSITIQKSSHHVTLLIADTHLDHWNTQSFRELGYTS